MIVVASLDLDESITRGAGSFDACRRGRIPQLVELSLRLALVDSNRFELFEIPWAEVVVLGQNAALPFLEACPNSPLC
jgi:hypothetical protein